MTNWEFRAKIIFMLMKVFNISLKDLYMSYPYNPYSETEVSNFWSDVENQYSEKKGKLNE